MKSKASIVLLCPAARLLVEVTHPAPALKDSWHRFTFNMKNPDDEPILDACFHVTLKPSKEDSAIDQKTDFCEVIGNGPSLPLSVMIGEIPADTAVVKTFHMFAQSLTTRHLIINVTYKSSKGEVCNLSIEEEVQVKQALEVTFTFTTPRCNEISQLFAHEAFFLLPQIDSVAPCPITIQKTAIQLTKELEVEKEVYECMVSGETLAEGDGSTCIACITINTATEQPIPLGNYTVTWNREGGELSTLMVALPSMTLATCALGIDALLPSYPMVKFTFMAQYFVYNHTDLLVPIDIVIEPSESFMFSGLKQMNLCIPPHTHYLLEYNLTPLVTGMVAMPRIRLSISPKLATQQEITDLINRSIPPFLFIMPFDKSKPLPQEPEVEPETEVISQEPGVLSQEPEVPLKEPGVLSQEPEVFSHEPEVPLHEPEVPLHKPEVPLHKPEVLLQKPEN